MTRFLAMLCLSLCCACGDDAEDASCSEGESDCPSQFEIRHCLDGVWGESQECPPETHGEFEVSTVCDGGLCRP